MGNKLYEYLMIAALAILALEKVAVFLIIALILGLFLDFIYPTLLLIASLGNFYILWHILPMTLSFEDDFDKLAFIGILGFVIGIWALFYNYSLFYFLDFFK